MKSEIFDKCMAMFFVTFPNIKYKKETLKVYQQLLKDITGEQLKTAIVRICNNVREIYPNTNFIALVREQLKVDTEYTSLLAWILTKKTVLQESIYQSIRFEDKVIHSVIMTFGGWEYFVLQFRDEDDKWIQQRFERLYNAMAYRSGHPEYLAGKCEIDNTAAGYTAKDSKALASAMKPKLITSEGEQKLLNSGE